MNRVQFFTLIALSTLVAFLVIGNLTLQSKVGDTQTQLARDQIILNEGNTAKNDMQAVANTIYQSSVRSNDQGLRDLMVRQRITPPPSPTNSSETPASPNSKP